MDILGGKALSGILKYTEDERLDRSFLPFFFFFGYSQISHNDITNLIVFQVWARQRQASTMRSSNRI